MPTLKATVTLELDGEMISGYPITRRIEVDEAQTFRTEKADDGDGTTFTDISTTGQLAEIQALILQADQQLTFRLDGQSDAGIVLNTNGLLLILDCDIDAGAATNITANNNSGSTANIKGIAGGT